jgi:hypothetical protein
MDRTRFSGSTRSAAPAASWAAVTAASSHHRRTIAAVNGSRTADVWLWFALVLPSSFIVQKYGGWGLLVAYGIIVAALLPFKRRLFARLHDRWLRPLSVLAAAVLVAAFVIVYPVANTHRLGAGSDDDDALNVGTRTMLAGRFPYSATTYLGNAVHQLPGALILASPFVLLGTSALQNLLWIPWFFLTVNADRGRRATVELLWTVLALSPAIMWEVVTGTGYISNTVSVLLGLWMLMRTKRRGLAAVYWGVALASRANFVLLVPLAFGYLRQHAGTRAAWRAAALTIATVAGLTLPFYLYDPRHFTPLEGADRLLVFDRMVPLLGAALVIAMAILAVALASRPMDGAALFRRAALLQLFPIAAGLLLSSIRDREINLAYARYGAFFAWFAFLAAEGRCTMSATPQCPTQLSGD